jgi:lipopolysaccharide/colanic/teichoic acid biosynthesis glycosyltransferase
VLASLLLLATLPVLGVALSAVRLTSKGPLIFKQYRVGRFGRPFVCFKIRTMVEGADALLVQDEHLHGSYAERWKLADDPRVFPVGRWLRRTSIDELPQLVNVLRGEMSIVGPRPVQLQELHERYGDLAEIVFSINPGLTGLWQVSGRSSVDYTQRIALDLEYVRRRSLWFDVLLVLKTIPAVFFSRGAC